VAPIECGGAAASGSGGVSVAPTPAERPARFDWRADTARDRWQNGSILARSPRRATEQGLAGGQGPSETLLGVLAYSVLWVPSEQSERHG
jgi:hypothetical protein